ncbi:unnamed protein product [Urochloa humidicola]
MEARQHVSSSFCGAKWDHDDGHASLPSFCIYAGLVHLLSLNQDDQYVDFQNQEFDVYVSPFGYRVHEDDDFDQELRSRLVYPRSTACGDGALFY